MVSISLPFQAFCFMIFHNLVLTQRCYHRLTTQTGTLMTHVDFTPFFKTKTHCIWDIEVPEGSRIQVDIRVFEIATDCCSCANDFVAFRDGFNDSSPLIGRYCAKNQPEKVYSSRNRLRVEFYSSVKSNRNNTSVNKFRADYITICGALIQAASGEIFSPSYSNSSNGICLYTILVPYGWVKLTFDSFNIETQDIDHESCENSYIILSEMYLVKFKGSRRSQVLCGQLKTNHFYSTVGQHLTLLYLSSKPTNHFKARFEAVLNDTNKCGGFLHQDMGYIYSYGFPQTYPTNTICTWNIEVRHGYIELQFLIFNFSCSNGHMDVFDGWSENSVKIWTYCGQFPIRLQRIVSRTTRLLVRARSGNHTHTGKFQLSYKITQIGLCHKDYEFTCLVRACVPKERVCDGNSDCLDGSDELNCPKGMPKRNKILYTLWILVIFIVFVIIGYWLWRTWKKSVRHSINMHREDQHHPCNNAENNHHGHHLGYRSQALPSYSEALLQTDGNLPTYEEAVGTREHDQQQVHVDGDHVRFINSENDTANTSSVPHNN